MRKKRYTDQDLINVLQDYYQNHDKVPTTRDVDKNKSYPSSQTLINRFGSYKNALIMANLYDLRDDKHMFDRKSYSDGELLDLLNKFITTFNGKHGATPTLSDFYVNSITPTISTYEKRFGSLDKAYSILDYKLSHKYSKTMNKTDEQIKQCLTDVIDKHGYISCKKFTDYGLPSFSAYKGRFNVSSYYELLDLFEFDESIKESARYMVNDEIIDMYYEIKSHYDTIPTIEDIMTYTKSNNLSGIWHKIYWRWGSYTDFLIDVGDYRAYKSRVNFSEDGVKNYSRYEQIISNLLFNNDIEYIKDLPYKDFIDGFDREYTVDYYLPQYDMYIEIFGMVGIDEYDIRVLEKQRLCKDNDIQLISIFPKDFQDNMYKMDEFILAKSSQTNVENEYRRYMAN